MGGRPRVAGMARTITIEATGRREATPELARVEAAAAAGGPTAAAARDAATDLAERIQSSLPIPEERVRTVDREVEDTEELFTADDDAPYLGTEELEVDCVPGDVDDAVVAVTDAGGRVQGVEFHLHEERRRELAGAALTDATRRAREEAERVAAAEGLAVGDLLEATAAEDLDDGFGSIVDEALGAADDAAPTPIAVRRSVEATFELVDGDD